MPSPHSAPRSIFMLLLGKVVVLDLARCEEVGDARRGKLRREHVVLTPKGGGVYFILFSSFHLHMQRFGFRGFHNGPTLCVNTANHIQTRKRRMLHSPFFLLVRMRSEPDVLIRKNPREALFTRLSSSYCVQLILALKDGGLGGRRGRRNKGADAGLKQGDVFFFSNILISHFIHSKTS